MEVPSLPVVLFAATLISSACCSQAFHDCVQASKALRRRRTQLVPQRVGDNPATLQSPFVTESCTGGTCVGMTNGPHQGGNASYPVAFNGTTGTSVHSRMTVPELPQAVDGITYYIWTDVFFGDASEGRMNQLVPQLILGSALDSSSGPPNYQPFWHRHETWAFGAHYFFETTDPDRGKDPVGRAAYGALHPTWAGEVLYTTFDLLPGGDGMDSQSPKWVLTMGVEGDDSRISRLEVHRPYMGMGERWEKPTTSWLEPSYRNMCINACWELYGADDPAHLPSSGAHYDLTILQPESVAGYYDFTSWEQDEGNGYCPSTVVKESHSFSNQTVGIDISVHPTTMTKLTSPA